MRTIIMGFVATTMLLFGTYAPINHGKHTFLNANFDAGTPDPMYVGNIGITGTSVAALGGSQSGLLITAPGQYAYYTYQANPKSYTGVFHARFYINLNTLLGSTDEELQVLRLLNDGSPIATVTIHFTGTGPKYLLDVYDDAGTPHPALYGIGAYDGEHYIELMVKRATSSTSSDGLLQWWLDGVFKQEVGSIDNYDLFSAFWQVVFGKYYHFDAITGSYYLDELIIVDKDKYIGPTR